MTTRCATVTGAAHCALPPIKTEETEHTCPDCRRVWRKVNAGHGPFWRWNGTDYARRRRP